MDPPTLLPQPCWLRGGSGTMRLAAPGCKCFLPRGKPRHPTSHTGAVFVVAGPELGAQMLLFVEPDEGVEEARDDEPVLDEIRCSIEDRPPEDDAEDADVDGVSHVGVETADDESLRR